MGDREHAPDTRRRLEAGGRSQCQSYEREMLKEFQTGERRGRGLSRRRWRRATKRSTAAADLDYKASILAAQILVERPEDRIYDDIAAVGNALLMGRRSAVLSSSQQPARERWADRRLHSRQLNTINPESSLNQGPSAKSP